MSNLDTLTELLANVEIPWRQGQDVYDDDRVYSGEDVVAETDGFASAALIAAAVNALPALLRVARATAALIAADRAEQVGEYVQMGDAFDALDAALDALEEAPNA